MYLSVLRPSRRDQVPIQVSITLDSRIMAIISLPVEVTQKLLHSKILLDYDRTKSVATKPFLWSKDSTSGKYVHKNKTKKRQKYLFSICTSMYIVQGGGGW